MQEEGIQEAKDGATTLGNQCCPFATPAPPCSCHWEAGRRGVRSWRGTRGQRSEMSFDMSRSTPGDWGLQINCTVNVCERWSASWSGIFTAKPPKTYLTSFWPTSIRKLCMGGGTTSTFQPNQGRRDGRWKGGVTKTQGTGWSLSRVLIAEWPWQVSWPLWALVSSSVFMGTMVTSAL